MSYLFNRLLKSKCRIFTCLSGGVAAIFGYQVYSLNQQFSNLLSHSALERENTMYIELNQSVAEEKLQYFSSQLHDLEQTLEILMKGPKSFSRCLLHVLKSESISGDHFSHVVKTLSSSNYSAGLAQQIAQSLDFKTTIELARVPGVDLALFLKPPQPLKTADTSKCSIKEELYKLVAAVDSLSDEQGKCAAHFVNIAQGLISKEKDEEFILNLEYFAIDRRENTHNIVELYLQALMELSRTIANAQVLINLGLLSVLLQVVRSYTTEIKLHTLSAQIVANLSQFEALHHQIFQSGWIGLLAEFMRSNNFALNLAAGKALANMDERSRKDGVFDGSIYLIHPLYGDADSRNNNSAGSNTQEESFGMDVVFIHGLLGGVAWTWRQSEVLGTNTEYTYCWPKDWLPQDVPALRILGVDYTTSLSHWKNRCPDDVQRSSIVSRANQVLLSLKQSGVGHRPIVWVAHSMGGLVVKQLLIAASRSTDPDVLNLVKNTKAILMMSVPHAGSSLATLNPTARFLFLPSVEVDELRKGSNFLDSLNADFKNLLMQHPIELVSLVETKATPVQPWGIEVKFVEPSSADLCCGEIHFIPVNHLEICKPLNRNAFVYQRLVKLLLDVQNGPQLNTIKPLNKLH